MTFDKNVCMSMVILAMLSGALRAETPVRKCANNSPLPLMVQIDDCTKLPCNFIKGTTSHMAIQFVANRNSMSLLRGNVRLSALGVRIPFELPAERSDVCQNLMYGAYCPLDSGEDVTYHLQLNVSEQQLEVPTKIEVTLLDELDASVVTCFVTDVRVKKRSQKSNRVDKSQQ